MNTGAKICVYAICKNESKFIERWIESIRDEADYIVVLDTGSTDDSVEIFKAYEPFLNLTIKSYDYMSELGYFRFDKARNDSLKLVPFDADICVVIDLDQIPRKGWGDIIRQAWKEGYREVYGKIVDHDENGNELNSWISRNVHPNSPLWTWDKVIHEGIDYRGTEEYPTIYKEEFVLDHYPDLKKDRSLYKELLYYACKEYPKDPYYGIYLGIELSRRGTKEEAKAAFKRCLKECDFTDSKDIQYQCYLNLAFVSDDPDDALDALFTAKDMGIETRRAYNLMADAFEKQGNADQAINMLEHALTIQSNSNDWTDDNLLYTSGEIEDRLSLFYYFQKSNYLKAIEYCCKAITLNPTDERLVSNLGFYFAKFIESRGKSNEE